MLMPPPSPPPPLHLVHEAEAECASLVFDASVLRCQSSIPSQFIWPDEEKPCSKPPELLVPPVDLGGFLSGDTVAVSNATRLANEACRKHGFFLVVNHGVDSQLVSEAHKNMDYFFNLSLSEKQRAQRKVGDHCGYASSFTGRFSTKLPWKETLSFRYCDEDDDDDNDDHTSRVVEKYILNVMGEHFEQFG